jgi:hypothetical protein
VRHILHNLCRSESSYVKILGIKIDDVKLEVIGSLKFKFSSGMYSRLRVKAEEHVAQTALEIIYEHSGVWNQ